MGRYKRRRFGRRSHTSRRVLPLLFSMMIVCSLFLILSKLPADILVIRDEGDTILPSETETEPTTAPDPVGNNTMAEYISHQTSYALERETGNIPAEPLPTFDPNAGTSVKKDPPRVIGMLERVPADYDYTVPVPENEPVDMQYLQDAVLVGDSWMQGLILYCSLSKITSYTYKGLTVDGVFNRSVIEWTEDENTPEAEKIPEELWSDGKIPVLEALKRTDFSKLYIMLGINETGWKDPADFPAVYGKMIDAVRESNPQCLIYVLSVFPVSQSASDSHPYAKNDKIAMYNQYLQEMAAEKQVFFVDLAPAVVNEDGVLPEDSGFDGIHLNKDYCMEVLNHIFTHTVPLRSEKEVRAELEAAEQS